MNIYYDTPFSAMWCHFQRRNALWNDTTDGYSVERGQDGRQNNSYESGPFTTENKS